MHVQLHVRACFHEAAHDGTGEGVEARGEGEHDAALGARVGADHRLGFLRGAHRKACLLEEQGARGREVDAARVALEQADAEGLLELGDHLRERRLGDVQLCRRARYLTLFDDDREVVKLADVK